MRYDVTAPVKGYNGVVGGVTFYRGHGHVDGSENPAAVAYFRRRGYTLTEVREEQLEQPAETQGEPPARPKPVDSKDKWVAYTVATTDLTEAEAADLTKAELQELADTKEQTS
jgi:hypothetical protein